MFHKDTLRLIRRSFNRFFSLLMIVLIGVAFMMGLFTTSTIMRLSMDDYDDKYHLQDLQLYSSYGFDDKDVRALQTQDYITSLFASRSVDVYSRNVHGDVLLMRLEELHRDINQFELTSGRLPEKENEMVLLASPISMARYALGDTLMVDRENE